MSFVVLREDDSSHELGYFVPVGPLAGPEGRPPRHPLPSHPAGQAARELLPGLGPAEPGGPLPGPAHLSPAFAGGQPGLQLHGATFLSQLPPTFLLAATWQHGTVLWPVAAGHVLSLAFLKYWHY